MLSEKEGNFCSKYEVPTEFMKREAKYHLQKAWERVKSIINDIGNPERTEEEP